MGMLGRWIDSLNDDDRDAILRHPDPTYKGWKWWDDEHGCGCLVGTVLQHRRPDRYPAPFGPSWREQQTLPSREAEMHYTKVGARFPKVVHRFGPERVWRAVKLRAAKNNGVDLDRTPAPETVAAGA